MNVQHGNKGDKLCSELELLALPNTVGVDFTSSLYAIALPASRSRQTLPSFSPFSRHLSEGEVNAEQHLIEGEVNAEEERDRRSVLEA